MDFNLIVHLFAVGLFSMYVVFAVFAKDDLKEIKYLVWALVILVANLPESF